MSLPPRLHLLTFAVRGHRLAPWPTGEEIPRPPRHQPHPSRDHRRYLEPEQYALVEAVIANRCRVRSGELVWNSVRPTHVHAVVRLPYFTSLSGFKCAVRPIATRRLRREAGWSRDESVYTKRVREEQLAETEIEAIRQTRR
jgi:hypothetical protein